MIIYTVNNYLFAINTKMLLQFNPNQDKKILYYED